MSMVIGKEAREALLELSQDPGRLTFFEYEDQVKTILECCTDAPEVGLPDVTWPAVVNLMRWTGKQVLAEPLMAAQLLSEADTLERWLEPAGQKESGDE